MSETTRELTGLELLIAKALYFNEHKGYYPAVVKVELHEYGENEIDLVFFGANEQEMEQVFSLAWNQWTKGEVR